ncbi:MAG: FecR domain-containing protein [Deltaproteobacteria bacterium]|nr:FecR domain-containing protein [Deltaproteobacteria bacterium]
MLERLALVLLASFSTCAAAPPTATAPAPAAARIPVGKAVPLKGRVSKGITEIRYARPTSGEAIAKPTEKGSVLSELPRQEPVVVQWPFGTHPFRTKKGRPLAATLELGEALKTDAGSSVELMLSDRSTIVLGAETILEVSRFEGKEKERGVTLKLVQGRIHVTIPVPVEKIGQFAVETPNAVINHRGLRGIATGQPVEFFAATDPMTGRESRTQVLCTHGQLSIETFKITAHGVAYPNTHVLNPSDLFDASGPHGLGLSTHVSAIAPKSLPAEVARFGVLR